MTYNYSMKCMVYGSKYDPFLKMLLLYLVEWAWQSGHGGMLSRFDFFLIGDRPFVFLVGGGGAGADFFQQLKLDFI